MAETRPATRDFTRPKRPINFTVDDDTFHAYKAIPAQDLMDFTTKYNSLETTEDPREQLNAMKDVLVLVLQPESYTLFTERLSDRERPIEVPQIGEILEWLMEQYGLRPTQPSSSSADGQPSPESGTPSTESVLATV